MVRVTKLTDYGIALMTCLANGREREQFSAQDLADTMRLPLPTVRKILKILARADLLDSTRGAAGGYTLARDPKRITMLDMVSALEGPLAMTECSNGDDCDCSLQKICGMKENWSWINQQFKETLSNYTLAQMAGRMTGSAVSGSDRTDAVAGDAN